MDATTGALARRAAAGERAAFEALLALHGRTLLAVARAHARDGHGAEDAFQEGVVRAWTSMGTLADPDRFVAWACAVVTHAAQDRARREKVRAAAPLPDAAPERPPSGPPEARREALVAAVAALPPPLREAVELFYFGGLTYRDIAAATGRSVPTVNLRLAEARRLLRARMESDHA
jgi:RNA polymerase sigma-70 factor (ECF subfamily)